jgi:hypothetical protein
MFKLPFLAMWLLAGAPGISSPADDACPQVVIHKLGDDNAKIACCPTTGNDTCQKMTIKGDANCCAKTACCPTTGKHACQKIVIKGGAGCCAKTACCPTTGKDACRQVVVTLGGTSGAGTPCIATTMTTANAGDDKIILREQEEAPEVWIGVRVTPVPQPLASHLKREGLMIANVAEDSPADQAGVERYDVVLSFNEKPINEMSDLLDAIGENGAAKAAQMVVIRGGKEQTLTITPVKRDDSAPPTFKYDEPEVSAVDPYVKYFGHRLRSLPGDKWIIEPHGQLDALPDNVKDFLKDLPDTDWEEWAEQWSDWAEKWSKRADEWSDLSKRHWRFHDRPFGLEIELDTDDAGPEIMFFGDLDDEDVEAEISISISENGETTEIHRAKDGTIQVQRENADGERSSATYEGLKQLREEDAEAYKLLRQCISPHGATLMLKTPKLKKLGDMQHEFQIKVERQLEKARDQYERALDQAREAQKKVTILKEHTAADQDADTRTELVMILIDDDGHITVEIKEDGSTKKYEFESREDFKKAEPELYERFRENLDETGAGARSDRLDSAPV